MPQVIDEDSRPGERSGNGSVNVDNSHRNRLKEELTGLAMVASICSSGALADPQIATQQGVPVGVIAKFQEPGIYYNVATGMSSTVGSGSASSGSGTTSSSSGNGGTSSGSGVTASSSGNGGTSSGSGATGSSVYSSMLLTSWGTTAADNAGAQGINASALAGLAQVESSMGTASNLSSGYAQGVFQMASATFNDAITAAVAADPSLADTIVQGDAGRQDPVTEAAAASEYLYDMATTAQSNGVSNPTFLDAYAYYMFGPGGGAQVENGFLNNPDTPMSQIVSATVISQNPSLANQTVGQWRASIANTVGSGIANSAVLAPTS